MEQQASHPTNRKEENNDVPLHRAKPSPSLINLKATSLPATFLNLQTTKLPSGAEPKPKESLGLLDCMCVNLQLQTQLAEQQMTILENLQASVLQLTPGKEGNSSVPALTPNLLLNQPPQFHK
ncbi:TSSK6-activating co-chaperone protein isoform X2 [Perognathus longimembris pacificus]|uniref:TSSK6-activating co-chaperone protein isoform X2 n=1 Tax=Perognathus longimembris pacificus TaxID=214514 RepID=UPI0020194696|nr:TSSK6-activating co-chaperone protein isoform X2 [Perognathus longimembris pacificus]